MVKKAAIILASFMLVGAMAYSILAREPHWRVSHQMIDARPDCSLHGAYNWRWNDTLTLEQRTKFHNLRQNFYDDTATLRNELWTKARLLDALLNTSDPDPEKTRSALREVSDLEAKLAEKGLDFELEARKIAPEARFFKGYTAGDSVEVMSQASEGTKQ
jgi:zinc resistance-associated protein